MESKSIALLNGATKMLAEVQTIDDAKDLMDMAAAAKHYAQKHGLGKEAVTFAKSIEISAEIKLGEILIQNKNDARKINAKKIIRESDGCVICGNTFKPILVVHHKKLICVGGESDGNNLIVLCPNCHAIAHRIIEARESGDNARMGRLALYFIKSNGGNIDKYMEIFIWITEEAT